ncbi:MAG: hypothetical protein QSU88_09575, partial [Candidatus Methanoperedens sp.]|nr:hypothetical protein [Candidatus Methanoperedens sp.]
MVRKIATALKMIVSGKRDIPWLEKMLQPSQFHEALEPAPAHGLILKSVEYRDIDAMAGSLRRRFHDCEHQGCRAQVLHQRPVRR